MPDLLTLEQFKQLFPRCQHVPGSFKPFVDSLTQFDINTPLRVAAYAAQIGHESNDLNNWEESLYYSSAQRLCAVWPRRFVSLAMAAPYVANPEALANFVYSNRMGNGDYKSGDGWRYRGRGPIQITGREMYTKIAKALRVDCINNPDLLKTDVGFLASAYFYAEVKSCNGYADTGRLEDFKKISQQINGGLNGWADRHARWERAQIAMGIQLVRG